MYGIYLDTCCLNRPFDDQRQIRVRAETEAVLAILRHVQAGEWGLVASDVLEQEVRLVPDPEQRIDLLRLVRRALIRVGPTQVRDARAVVLVANGFGQYDALHIASAESAGADVLLTTDDRLRKRAQRMRDQVGVRVEDPVTWLNEVREQ